jgi:type IX secretion system substrate protein
MKKFYIFLTTLIVLSGATNQLFSQATYTAIRSGNWSSAITWDPSGKPSAICNNCTVTISAGLTIQLDAHVELTGTSVFNIGDGNPGVTQIVIGNSSSANIPTGYNIVLDTLPGSSIIALKNSSSSINAASAGIYDGIFSVALVNGSYTKEVGVHPSGFNGSSGITNTGSPIYGTSVSGPSTLFSGGTLPLTLTSFNAALNDNVVNVTWAVDEESNLSHFVVLRSGDGSSWVKIGNVAAQTSSSANYSFTDPSPYHGINYYRLQSVDNNGNYKLSEVKLIRGLFTKGLIFGPNPANDHISLTFGTDISAKVTVRLMDQYGKVLQQKELSNAVGTTISFQLSNYPQGIYTLHVKGADGSQSAFRVLVTR